MSQDRKGIDKYTHERTRWWVDLLRDRWDMHPDDKSDDYFDFFRYDNDRGWIPVKKDKAYIVGHILVVIEFLVTVITPVVIVMVAL